MEIQRLELRACDRMAFARMVAARDETLELGARRVSASSPVFPKALAEENQAEGGFKTQNGNIGFERQGPSQKPRA